MEPNLVLNPGLKSPSVDTSKVKPRHCNSVVTFSSTSWTPFSRHSLLKLQLLFEIDVDELLPPEPPSGGLNTDAMLPLT